MSLLFEPITLRSLTVKNRVWLPPMCQYSVVAHDGVPNEWHRVHYGARAVGGFGLIIAEATGVSPEGRITPQDTGIWNEAQVEAWRPIVDFAHAHGAAMAVQLQHAGRKASTYWPWSETQGSVPLESDTSRHSAQGADATQAQNPSGVVGWQTVAPSEVAFPGYDAPHEMSKADIEKVINDFAAAASNADKAGFDAVEIHAAHGYLLHQFLSPLSNFRTDEYGGSLENRARLLREVLTAIRAVFPEHKPVFVRVSATDWTPGGLEPDDVAAALLPLKDLGLDLVDVSTGGVMPARIPNIGPGYQLPAARRIRELTGLPTAAVGLITEPAQAEQVRRDGDADVVLIGRAALRDPIWPLRAAHTLNISPDNPAAAWPVQYNRGYY